MRILFLTPFLPHPAAPHGGGSYLGALASGLGREAELGLVHIGHPDERHIAADAFAWRASAPYEGAPDGLGHRLRMLWRWRRAPLLAAKYFQPQIRGAIARAREQFAPDVALVELAQMAQYLPDLHGLPTILTDHEAGRPANAATGHPLADRRDRRLWQRYVARFYPMASAVQALTAEDAAELARQTGLDVSVRPPVVRIPDRPVAPASAAPRVLFVGNYRHRPNEEAAHRLVDEVWPSIHRRCPDAELLLAGPHEAGVRSCGGRPGVRVLGFVDDLGALFADVRLLLAPLWSGGGFRVKNASALAHGLPIVTNELGARGCRAPAPGCTIGETPAELADATVRLLQDPALAARGGERARSWALERFDLEAVTRRQLQTIEALLARRRQA